MVFSSYILNDRPVAPKAPVKPSLPSTNPTMEQVEKYLEALKNAPTKEDWDNYSKKSLEHSKLMDKFNNDQAVLMQKFVADVCKELDIPFVKAKINASLSEMQKFYDKRLNCKRANDEFNKLCGDIDLSTWDIPEYERKFLVDFLNDAPIRDYEISDHSTPENEELYKKIYVATTPKSDFLLNPDERWDYKQGTNVYTSSTRLIEYIIKRLGGDVK